MQGSKSQGPPVKWDEVVSRFHSLTGSIEWILRFRLQYYQDANLLSSAGFGERIRFFWHRLIQTLGHAAWIKLSLLRPGPSIREQEHPLVFLMCDNPTYQSTIIPVLKGVLEHSQSVTILTRKRAVEPVRGVLSRNGIMGGTHIVCYEDLAFLYTLGSRWKMAFRAIAGCLKDLGVWLISGLERRYWTAPRLTVFSLVNRFYGKAVEDFLSGTGTIVAANDHVMWEALIFDSAREMTAETFVLQHGVLGEFSFPMFTKKYLVWGQYHKDVFFEKLGGPPEAITVAGSPRYDEIQKKIEDFDEQKRDTISFLSQSHGTPFIGEEGYYQVVDLFFRLAGEHADKGFDFVLKLHPFDEEGYFNPALRKYGDVVRLTRGDLLNLLARSKMTVLLDSTAVFEAALMGVPVIQLKTEQIRRFADFSEDGLTTLCQSYTELELVFKSITGDDQYSEEAALKMETVLDRYFANRGTSRDYIVNMILQSPQSQNDG